MFAIPDSQPIVAKFKFEKFSAAEESTVDVSGYLIRYILPLTKI